MRSSTRKFSQLSTPPSRRPSEGGRQSLRIWTASAVLILPLDRNSAAGQRSLAATAGKMSNRGAFHPHMRGYRQRKFARKVLLVDGANSRRKRGRRTMSQTNFWSGFEGAVRTTASARVFEAAKAKHAVLVPFASIEAVVASVSPKDEDHREAVLVALLSQHQAAPAPVWSAALALAMRPTLISLMRSFRALGDDADAAVLTSFFESASRVRSVRRTGRFPPQSPPRSKTPPRPDAISLRGSRANQWMSVLGCPTPRNSEASVHFRNSPWRCHIQPADHFDAACRPEIAEVICDRILFVRSRMYATT
jgi:hypothetical protein